MNFLIAHLFLHWLSLFPKAQFPMAWNLEVPKLNDTSSGLLLKNPLLLILFVKFYALRINSLYPIFSPSLRSCYIHFGWLFFLKFINLLLFDWNSLYSFDIVVCFSKMKAGVWNSTTFLEGFLGVLLTNNGVYLFLTLDFSFRICLYILDMKLFYF